MSQLTVYEKLDFVFFLIKDKKIDTVDELRIHIMGKKVSITSDELTAILLHLQGNSLVATREFKHIDQYLPTIFGLTFEGFVNQQAIKNSESNRLARVEFIATADRRLTTRLTTWIAVGSIIAGLYYLIEIYRLLHIFFHSHGHYWIWETIPVLIKK